MKSGVSIRDKDPADSTFDRPNLYPEESGRCDFYTLDVSDLAFGWLPVVEVDAKGVTAAYPTDRSYCWGLDVTGTLHGAGGVGGLLLTTDGTRHHIPLYDANGNVQGLINANTGAMEAVYSYSAFGELLGYKNPVGGTHAQDNPIRFASKYYDSETGLYQYNHRFYSPKLGRFITRDPVGEYGGLNLYAYCANRPVDRWDYLGLDGRATLVVVRTLYSILGGRKGVNVQFSVSGFI